MADVVDQESLSPMNGPMLAPSLRERGGVQSVAPVLAGHMDVNAIDLTGAPASDRAALERAAAGNLKRVLASHDGEQWTEQPGTRRLLATLEIKTVWHPAGI